MGFLTGQRERRSWIGEPPIPPFPGARMDGATGVGSTMTAALALPAVWQCVNLIANTISVMPLETFRRTSDIPTRIPDPKIVMMPSGVQTQSSWMHSLMVSLLLRGNAVGKIMSRDAGGYPTQIDLLNPDKVSARENGDGTIDWTIAGRAAEPNTIWHLPGLTPPGSKIGISPIDAGAMTLGIDLNSRKFASDYFSGGGIPKAVLTSDQQINQQQGRTIKDRFLAATRNREPAILGAGVKYQAIQVNPDEAQFLATQQLSISQIARFFAIPPKMIGGTDGTSLTYANVEQLQLDFLVSCIAFWLKRIEDAFFPLLPQPQFVKFREDSLLRLDAETQAKVDLMYLAGKVRVPSEIRNRLSLPPMTDDQKAEADMVPLTITPSGGAKALPNLKLPPGPSADVPADDQQGANDAA